MAPKSRANLQKMASSFICPLKSCCYAPLIIILAILMLSCLHTVKCVELDVGGDNGWVTPPTKNQQFYNDWASKNRFQVNDSLRFEYKKDSVMVVTEEEYEKCRSSHPIFFANNGDTVFALDRPGLFYFISGVAGHCERGLKMIVKVLDAESPPQAAAHTSHKRGAAAAISVPVFGFVSSLAGVIFIM